MATVVYCDKCGSQDLKHNVKQVRLDLYNEYYNRSSTLVTVDLCEQCRTDAAAYLKLKQHSGTK